MNRSEAGAVGSRIPARDASYQKIFTPGRGAATFEEPTGRVLGSSERQRRVEDQQPHCYHGSWSGSWRPRGHQWETPRDKTCSLSGWPSVWERHSPWCWALLQLWDHTVAAWALEVGWTEVTRCWLGVLVWSGSGERTALLCRRIGALGFGPHRSQSPACGNRVRYTRPSDNTVKLEVRERQEDCYKCKVNMGYLGGFRPVWATEWDLALKSKIKTTK